jgi:SRSO17 transposase
MDTQQLSPEPLEQYCQLFDAAFTRPTQQATFRTSLQGLLLGTERHKTATGLANTEPGQLGSRHKDAQRVQWFLSESTWDPEELNHLRLAMLRTLTSTAPCDGAVLVIDETGDRNYGTHTAHIGTASDVSRTSAKSWGRDQRAENNPLFIAGVAG